MLPEQTKFPAVIISSVDRDFLLRAAAVPGLHQAFAQAILKHEIERIMRTIPTMQKNPEKA